MYPDYDSGMNSHFSFHDANSLLPREKISQYGIESLKTEELLRVILGSGSKKYSVHRISKEISEKIGSKKTLQLEDLLAVKGVGFAKACQILAAIELVERIRPIGFPFLDSLQKVLIQLSELRYLPREQIVCLYLNSRLQLLVKETIAIGGLNQTAISARDIFAVIKYHPVSHLILAHNHPSGICTPSVEDITFTSIIQEAGHLLGVELLDHVIVGKEEHFSFREQKKLIVPG